MGHKFDDRWSCFIIAFDDDGHYDHELASIGTMYLTFKRNGELEHGFLEYEEKHKKEPGRLYLKGRADSGFSPQTIQLESDDSHLFEGTLTFESDNHESMVITGKVHFPEDSGLRRLIASITAQDDPPWVITKP